MNRRSVLMVAAFAIVTVAACSNDEATTPKAPAAGTAAVPAKPASEAALPKIPILPDYKYYVGGPRMKEDAYGSFRLAGFNGEVEQPPSRGMIFGVKRDGDQIEYRVWGNGVLLGLHRGVMRDGLFWKSYVEGYKGGRLIAREHTTHDDEAKRSKVVVENVDPETGELIRTTEHSLSYFPPKLPEDEGDEGDDDEEDGDGETAPVPGAKDAAPVDPPKNAAE